MRLAAFLTELDLFELEFSSKYKFDDWRDDLRKLLRLCGLEGETRVLLLPDYQLRGVRDSRTLEDVNVLLNSCDIQVYSGPFQNSTQLRLTRRHSG